MSGKVSHKSGNRELNYEREPFTESTRAHVFQSKGSLASVSGVSVKMVVMEDETSRGSGKICKIVDILCCIKCTNI